VIVAALVIIPRQFFSAQHPQKALARAYTPKPWDHDGIVNTASMFWPNVKETLRSAWLRLRVRRDSVQGDVGRRLQLRWGLVARKRKPNEIDDAEDVLAGRRTPDASDLLDLVHAINPTAREVDERERFRRYALKSKLQSLLIRNFGDELTVTANVGGVVAIAHRYRGRDACHARLDTLDLDARAWVQWRLDTGDDDDPVHASSSSGDAPASPLDRGRQALADYDYDTARTFYEEALAASPHDVGAARALLELLVDLLAQDGDALALAERLPSAMLADSEIRSLLALATARAGDPKRARRWLADIAGPRATEAWIVLARAALALEAFDEVERAIREAEAGDPSNPASVEIRMELAARRRELRAPDEARLEALTADDATVRTQAREVLARWPDSAVAAKLLNAIDQRDRQRERSRLIAAAEAALETDLPRARELVDRAAALGEGEGEVKELAARIARAEASVREVRHAAQVAHVVELGSNGYATYLALEPALRERVRALDARPAFGWLDALRSKTAVAAVQALERALAAETADPALASRLLEEHELDLRDARQLRDRLREARRARQLQLLADARAAWPDVERTGHLLDQLELRTLDPESRALATELVDTVRRHRERTNRLVQVDALIADRRLLEARHELERFPDDAQRLADVRAAIRATWPMQQAAPGPIDLQRLGAVLGPLPYRPEPEPSVTSAGEVVLATVHDRLAIVAVLDLERDRMELRSVVTPAPLGHHHTSRLDGERLWIVGQAWLVQLDWRSGELCRWHSLAELIPPEHTVERIFLLPRDSVMWIETRHLESGERVQLVDLDTWRVIRTPTKQSYHYEVPGEPARIAEFDSYTGATVYDGRARLVGELVQLARQRVSSLVRHPLEEGLIAAVSEDVDDDTSSELVLVELFGGTTRRKLPLPGTDPDRIFSLVSARADQHLFAFYRDGEGASLIAIRATDMTIAYRVPAPIDCTLVHDVACQRAYAIWDSAELGIVRLGASPPELGTGATFEQLPSFKRPFYCAYATKPHLLEPAEDATRDHQWDRVRDLLAAISPDDLDEGHRPHFHHLRGLAFARTGDLVAATNAWQTGRALLEDRLFPCPFDACLGITTQLPDPLPDTWWDHTTSPLRQLRGAIATADACRAHDDLAGALAALQRRAVYRSREIQSLARLADLMLTTELVDPFERTCVLASFLDAFTNLRSNDLPIADAWSAETIALVAARARQRLGF